MIRHSYFMLLAAASLMLAACGDKHETDEPNTPATEIVIRSVSIEDGATISPVEVLTVDYNNMLGVDDSRKATVNGNTVLPYVNPDNRMQLIVPVNCEWNKDYTVTIPDGLVYWSSDKSVTAKGFTVSFNTKIGMNPADVAAALTNSKATPEAKALYQELLSNYGKVIYSGAMGGVNWETGYTDFIAANNNNAGYPKIVGFDYIHLPYSKEGSWINYGDITPVAEIWKAGSIPTVTWHWLTPNAEETDGEIAFDNNLSYNSNFSPLRALTPGTPENELINADIEKLAGYIKLLQEAGIPLLFRPFHEAAGDYTWGSWFWWGNDGISATIEMWKYLRHKLQEEYGLNNLIWIWTMQTSTAGKLADPEIIKAAYPGDDLVDMVGVDLYPDIAMTDQTEQFNLVNSVVNGKKMVALCEVGNLIDPEAAAANNALWSYFMNWYDYASEGVFGFNLWNSRQVTFNGQNYSNPWAAVANSPYVKNR